MAVTACHHILQYFFPKIHLIIFPAFSSLFLRQGCADIDNVDNAGIERIIDALNGTVSRHAIDGISRADIWALAATVGTDFGQRSNSRVDMNLKWWGRVDCEKTGLPCRAANGAVVPCSAKKGTHRALPAINLHTHELYNFFLNNFGFNQRDTVTIMGAHTFGVLRMAVRIKMVLVHIGQTNFPHRRWF